MNWMEDDNENEELEHPATPYGLFSPSYDQQMGIKTPQIGTPQYTSTFSPAHGGTA